MIQNTLYNEEKGEPKMTLLWSVNKRSLVRCFYCGLRETWIPPYDNTIYSWLQCSQCKGITKINIVSVPFS